ncbi:MAG: alpha/beta fold hydrolase [Lachnospiraceae bacterium]
MQTEEYGREHEEIIVMLHGANFVHTFGRQYVLADQYHLIVPHLMGYGRETDQIFDAEKQVEELAEWIAGFHKKVLLVGFSLGAQIAFKLVSEHEELFTAAIIVSPWLDKNPKMLDDVMKQNEKQFASFKKKWLCNFIGFMNGLPKEQRKEFVEQMQNVKIETVRNSVDNGITLDSVKGFENISVPVYALAGEKEQAEVTGSVKAMAEKNKNCTYEIWKNAAHNIPPLFYKQFNELLRRVASESH